MTTTNTQRVERNIESATSHLHITLGATDDMEQITLAVHGLAKAQGALEIAQMVDAIHADAVERGDDSIREQARIGHALLGILARGADDVWSGRRNDLARARFDGTREEAKRHIAYSL